MPRACSLGYLSSEHFPEYGVERTNMTDAQEAFWKGQVDGMYEKFSTPTS
jgi:hypothetical protein